MSEDHSRVAPSAMHLTIACAASLQLQERTPAPPDTEEILEGRAAHYVAAFAAAASAPLALPLGSKFNHAGREWTVDEDMYDGAMLWAETVGMGANIEQRVECKRVHPECWGTPDAWRFWHRTLDTRALLRVYDYKYGHRYVDPFENVQLGTYAIGLLEQLGISSGDDTVDVELVIVQPRAYHRDGPVQRWKTTAFGLNQAVLVPARAAAVAALVQDPAATTGRHCVDCKARHGCVAIQRVAADVVDYSMTGDLAPLTTDAAATELVILDEAAERLKARRTGLAAQLEDACRRGQRVMYYGMVPGRALLKWNGDVSLDEIKQLADMAGVPLFNDPEPLTPKQAGDALHRKGIDRKVIDGYATRQPSGVSLKRDDTTARKVFKHNA